MRCLLDTHAFLWWVDDDPRLPKRARDAIAKNDCSVSLVSAWEMAIKASLGELRLSLPVSVYFERHVAASGFDVLGIDLAHVGAVEGLPHHHGDPFDRLLIAQAKAGHMTLVSADKTFAKYGVKRIW